MRNSEESQGQILLMAAAGLVTLLVIGALVLDLGFAVMERRQEQNAVDPGALAAARFIDDVAGQTIDMPNARQAACYYARQNGFYVAATDNSNTSSGCVPSNDPKGAVLEVVYPPDGRAGQFEGHVGMVQVVLTRQQKTFFGTVLGIGNLSIASDAVAARQRGQTNSHSLIALNPIDCASGWIHGNGTIQIDPAPGFEGDGGYVQINSECGQGASGDDTCSNATGALRMDGTTTLLRAPKVNVHGGCRSQNANGIDGVLDEAAVRIGDPLQGLVPPRINTSQPGASCGVTGQATLATGNRSRGCGSNMMPWVPSVPANCPGLKSGYDCVELQPGVYYGGWNIGSKVQVKLAPGIYIIAGGGVRITATGSLDSVTAGNTLPAPILIFNTDNPAATCPGGAAYQCQDDLDLTAGATLKIAGLLGNQPCPPITTSGGCPYGGLVIWYDANGSQGADYSGYVDIEGGVELFISGTIYAPRATVDIHGNVQTNCSLSPTQTASVQIISWMWKLGGTGDLCMPYDPTLLYRLSLQGLVH